MSDTPNQTIPAATAPALSIDERIAAMEAALPRANIAGTTLSRVLHEKQGLAWCLALGPLQLPKTFFSGPTIESVLTQGEEAIANMKGTRLMTDWDKLDLALMEADEAPVQVQL